MAQKGNKNPHSTGTSSVVTPFPNGNCTHTAQEGQGSFDMAAALRFIFEPNRAQTISQRLTEAFGSFSSILEAPEKELSAVVGEKAARFVKTMFDAVKIYSADHTRALERIYNTDSARTVLAPAFIGRKTECVALLILDGRGYAIYNGIISEGAVSAVPIYVRRVVELCIAYCADTVILAHNHPSGNAMPSRNDLIATEGVNMALKSIDVQLYDHLILTESDFFSMREAGWLEGIDNRIVQRRRENISAAKAIEDDFFG